jgi:hypothetical protein
VVNRFNWHAVPDRRGADRGDFLQLVGMLPEASFRTRAEADAEQARLEQAARERVNPFATGPAPHRQTSMPAGVLRDWLLDADITPPAAGADSAAWRTWWQAEAKGWTAQQRAKAWEALDKVRFYEVEALAAGELVFLSAAADEHYFDAWYTGIDGAFRTRQPAEDDCARRNAEDEDRELVPCEPLVGGPFDPLGNPASTRRRSDCCDFEQRPRLRAEPHGTPYNEVFELEVVGRPRGAVHVVVRNVLGHERRYYTRNPMEGGPCHVFVRGFASKSAAEKFCKEQEAAAWELIRPGQLPCEIPEDFPEAVLKLGLPPPTGLGELPARAEAYEKTLESLLDWWESLGEKDTVEVRRRVWKLLAWRVLGDFPSFFQVLTVPLGD